MKSIQWELKSSDIYQFVLNGCTNMWPKDESNANTTVSNVIGRESFWVESLSSIFYANFYMVYEIQSISKLIGLVLD